jgi:hypothetical protein
MGICRKSPGGTSVSHYKPNETFVEGQFNVSAQSLNSVWGIYSNKYSEDVGLDYFYVQTPCDHLIEDYTEIFCTIYKLNIFSIQCKMRHKWSTTTRKVDSPNLSFINFDIPALRPGLYSAEASLEFSNNKTLLAICRIQTGVVWLEG